MTQPDERPIPGCLTAVCGLIAWLLLAGILGTAAVAHCQTDAEVLARTFISEEGWDGDAEGGWYSIAAVMRSRLHRGLSPSLRHAAEALSPRLHARPCTVTTRLWRCDLSADLHRPTGLGASWTRERAGGLPSRRDALAAALEAARAVLMGAEPIVCRTEPHAWGSEADVALRLRAGERWEDAGCPGHNRYGRRWRRR